MSLRKMREWRDCRDARLSAVARQVLMALLTYADPEGFGARPSLARLAADCGRSVRAVQRALAGLRRLGAVAVERQATRYDPTVYTVLSPAGVTRVSPLKGEWQAIRGDTGGRPGVTPVSPDQLEQIRKSIKAAPQTAPAHPVEKGQPPEVPTAAQLTKLVATIIDDPYTQLEDRGELEELVKRACSRGHFLYDTVVVDAAIRRVLAARGLNPDARDLRHAGRRR